MRTPRTISAIYSTLLAVAVFHVASPTRSPLHAKSTTTGAPGNHAEARSKEQSPGAPRGSPSSTVNPKSTIFNAAPDKVLDAAMKAAVGHHIVIPQDEGLKNLTEAGEEIKSFKFATSLPGVTFRVIEDISVEPLADGTSKLEVFFYKDRGSILYVPSDSYKLREAQLKNQLERTLSAFEQKELEYQSQYEITHSIDLETYLSKQKEIRQSETDAEIHEIEEERVATIADLAGMPTSSFLAMNSAADNFVNLVEHNLQTGKSNSAVEASH
jgi:hypothetical protein